MAIDTPIASSVNDVAAIVDDVIEVNDEAMLDAMALLLGSASLVAEPSGAAGACGDHAEPRRCFAA